MSTSNTKGWALVLGASSGFGGATCLEMARAGLNIFGVHLDRKQTMDNVDRIVGQIKESGREAIFFNMNAADDAKRNDALDRIADQLGGKGPGDYIQVLLHSLAFGALRPFIGSENAEQIQRRHLEMTLDVMANSLIYWVQGLIKRDLLREQASKIFAMTSAGGHKVWGAYGAVSAAKAALESHIRQIAYELAPRRIAANTIRAGVTDTPALRAIPGHNDMIDLATQRNPGGRLTQPEDVARAIATLIQDDNAWLTGNVIGVDGGEFNCD